jgi:hypothetical protein
MNNNKFCIEYVFYLNNINNRLIYNVYLISYLILIYINIKYK